MKENDYIKTEFIKIQFIISDNIFEFNTRVSRKHLKARYDYQIDSNKISFEEWIAYDAVNELNELVNKNIIRKRKHEPL